MFGREHLPWIAVGALVLVAALVENARGAGRALGAGAADLATGLVEGVGEGVGVPLTSEEKCTADLANGDLWEASFSCPAGRWLGAVWGSE